MVHQLFVRGVAGTTAAPYPSQTGLKTTPSRLIFFNNPLEHMSSRTRLAECLFEAPDSRTMSRVKPSGYLSMQSLTASLAGLILLFARTSADIVHVPSSNKVRVPSEIILFQCLRTVLWDITSVPANIAFTNDSNLTVRSPRSDCSAPSSQQSA